MDAETANTIETIERALIEHSVLGFDAAMLSVLDDVESEQAAIENLKSALGPDIFAYLFNIANSAYHGSLKVGSVQHFFDVVNRLGMHYTKVSILQYAMHRIARGGEDAEIIYAKSFSAAVMGRIMARGFGYRDDAARKVELACLLSNIGALMMTVYRNHYDTAHLLITDEFIEHYHLYLTERIMRKFQLPDYLNEMILTHYFVLERMGIGLSTVVKMAIGAVEWSFRTMHNRLVFRAPSTSLDNRFAPSLAGMIEDQFAAAGLKKFLLVLPSGAEGPQVMLFE